MSSRDEILKAIRAQRVADADLPSLDQAWIRYEDPWSQFQAAIAAVGGSCARVASSADIQALLQAHDTFTGAARIVSRVPGVAATFDLDAVDDPHALESVDWAIMPGHLGVAENGAIWVNDVGLKHRAIYFIVQHLALVLPTQAIVHNMHEAYQRIALGESDLGAFISGPSKTADIEQSLVIGAHGPRSLLVVGVDG